jgi:hypothetical protein
MGTLPSPGRSPDYLLVAAGNNTGIRRRSYTRYCPPTAACMTLTSPRTVSGVLVPCRGWHDSPRCTPTWTTSTWDFGDLTDEILPLSREELEELRAQRQEESSEKHTPKDAKGARKAPKGREDVERRVYAYTLALDRLSDLQLLLRLRELDKLPSGQRNDWMFAAGTSLAYLVEPQRLE